MNSLSWRPKDWDKLAIMERAWQRCNAGSSRSFMDALIEETAETLLEAIKANPHAVELKWEEE